MEGLTDKLNNDRQTNVGTEEEKTAYLKALTEECRKELQEIGIPVGGVTQVSVNYRARKRWGQCRQEGDGYHISISSRLLNGDTEDGLRETIMHELLHTCPMCNNHGAMWKHYADYVNRKLGLHIKRVNSNEDKGLPPESEQHVLHQYHCEGCGQVVRKQRECKFTRMYEQYHCTICGGRFIKEF